jgi:hypothetical protein
VSSIWCSQQSANGNDDIALDLTLVTYVYYKRFNPGSLTRNNSDPFILESKKRTSKKLQSAEQLNRESVPVQFMEFQYMELKTYLCTKLALEQEPGGQCEILRQTRTEWLIGTFPSYSVCGCKATGLTDMMKISLTKKTRPSRTLRKNRAPSDLLLLRRARLRVWSSTTGAHSSGMMAN